MTHTPEPIKFELTDTTITHWDVTLYQIRATEDIPHRGIRKGNLGGYVSSTHLPSGDARVSGNAWVSGDAQVFGNARVSGNARVESQTDWLLVGPAKSSGRFTTAYRDTKIGVRVSCGCFTGTAQEFSAQIEATHAGNQQHLQQYRLFCQLIAFSFDIQPA